MSPDDMHQGNPQAPASDEDEDIHLGRFALVDDEALVGAAWKMFFPNQVEIFSSPEALLGEGADLEESRTRLERFAFLVTDFYFDTEGPIGTGADLARMVRDIHPMPVVLCSNTDWDEERFAGLFSAHLPKSSAFATELKRMVREGLSLPVQSAHRVVTSPADESRRRLRHDIRNHLACLEILACKLADGEVLDDSDMEALGQNLESMVPFAREDLLGEIRAAVVDLGRQLVKSANWSQAVAQFGRLVRTLSVEHHADPQWFD